MGVSLPLAGSPLRELAKSKRAAQAPGEDTKVCCWTQRYGIWCSALQSSWESIGSPREVRTYLGHAYQVPGTRILLLL